MIKWWYFTYGLIFIDYSSFKTYGRWWALYSQQTHPEAIFEGCDKNIFFSREFRLFSLQFGYCVDNKLLIVIRDLVNVDTKRSYLCLTQTFIVLWIAWSVSTSTDAVASSRRRILFLWVYCTYDLMLHFYVNGWWLQQKRRHMQGKCCIIMKRVQYTF